MRRRRRREAYCASRPARVDEDDVLCSSPPPFPHMPVCLPSRVLNLLEAAGHWDQSNDRPTNRPTGSLGWAAVLDRIRIRLRLTMAIKWRGPACNTCVRSRPQSIPILCPRHPSIHLCALFTPDPGNRIPVPRCGGGRFCPSPATATTTLNFSTLIQHDERR